MESRSKLRDFVRALFGQRHDYREGIYTFEKLDIPRLKREMRLADLGEENGRANRPSSANDEPDAVEHRITNLIQAKREEAHEHANAQFLTIAERLAATSIEGRATDIQVEINGRIADFIAAIKRGENTLHLARREVLDAERSLKTYRDQHGLDRPAEYPDSHWWAFATIFAIVAVESVLNGLFLGDAQRYGIAGGIAIALMISVANVLLGFAVGRWAWCGLRYRGLAAKAGSLILMVVLTAALVAVNLAAGHYRAALLGGNWRTPETEALATLLAHPLGIGDLKSWLLCVIGILCASVAIVKGHDWDDPYRGYGRRDRAYKRIVRNYEDAMADVMDEIDAIKNDAITEAQTQKRAIEARREARARILGHRQRLASNFAEHMRHLEGALRELMSAYRGANIKARQDRAPPRFDAVPPFEPPSIVVSEDLDARKEDAAYARINETLKAATDSLLSKHSDAQRCFDSIRNLSYEEIDRAREQAAAVAA